MPVSAGEIEKAESRAKANPPGSMRRSTASRRPGTSAPRACGDDPAAEGEEPRDERVLPAHAGMIPRRCHLRPCGGACSPRMRG